MPWATKEVIEDRHRPDIVHLVLSHSPDSGEIVLDIHKRRGVKVEYTGRGNKTSEYIPLLNLDNLPAHLNSSGIPDPNDVYERIKSEIQ